MARIANLDYEFPSTVSAVLFNGRKIKKEQVRIADEEKGELTTYILDEKGRYVFDPARKDVKIHTFKGEVKIEWNTK